jgi:hypothetical protein
MRLQTVFNTIYLLLTGLCLVACSSTVVETVEQTDTAPPPTDTPLPPTETPAPVTDTPSPVERGRAIFEKGGAHES